MKIRQLRNATMLMTIAGHRLLVDPMLAEPASLPGFKIFGGGRRANPLVGLPEGAEAALEGASGVLVTHEHPDHLDRAAIRWIIKRELPVWAAPVDVPNLKKKGLDARVLRGGALGMAVEVIPSQHGRGVIGWLMGPVSGYYLAHPEEPSVYVTGDAVLSDAVAEAIERLQPDLIVAPAGAANFGFGGDLLCSVDELVALVKRAPGEVVLNHLEALDHCPTSRQDLHERMAAEGLSERVHIPSDGEELRFKRRHSRPHAQPRTCAEEGPGFRKWLTAWFAGT